MAELIYDKKALTLSTACDDPLARAVIISLFAWARARDDDDVQEGDRQGWWGDFYNADERQTGSRLWELLRNKITEDTLLTARQFCEEALQWMIEDAIAKTVAVTVERGDLDRVDFLISITKPSTDTLSIRFQDVWSYLK